MSHKPEAPVPRLLDAHQVHNSRRLNATTMTQRGSGWLQLTPGPLAPFCLRGTAVRAWLRVVGYAKTIAPQIMVVAV
jgi:hypothetical protein